MNENQQFCETYKCFRKKIENLEPRIFHYKDSNSPCLVIFNETFSKTLYCIFLHSLQKALQIEERLSFDLIE